MADRPRRTQDFVTTGGTDSAGFDDWELQRAIEVVTRGDALYSGTSRRPDGRKDHPEQRETKREVR